MQKVAPLISCVFWTLWLLLSILDFAQSPFIPMSAAGIGLFWSFFGVKAAGIALSILLLLRPNRGLAFLLACLSLFAYWKFYLGGILINMTPQFGGLTFGQSVTKWWGAITIGWLHALRAITFLFFVCASVLYWPWHAVRYQRCEPAKIN